METGLLRTVVCRSGRDDVDLSTLVFLPQRLLDVGGTGQRQQTPRAQKKLEAFKDFLDPSRGGYSWREAHADMGRLAGILGQMMEVRGCHRRRNEAGNGGARIPLILALGRQRQADF